MANSANRTLVSAGPNQRDTDPPTAATANAPIPPTEPKPRRYHAATNGIASPTHAPATGPIRATARGTQDEPIAAPTRMPAANPVRIAQTAVPKRIVL